MKNNTRGSFTFRQVGGGIFEGMKHEAEFKVENGVVFTRVKGNHFAKWQVSNNLPDGAEDVKFE